MGTFGRLIGLLASSAAALTARWDAGVFGTASYLAAGRTAS